MKAPAEKSHERQRQAAAREAPQQQGRTDAELQFVDNRPETTSLRQFQEAVDNSPRRTSMGSQAESNDVTVQRVEDEELLQGQFKTMQRQGDLGEDELLQGKFEAVQKQENKTDLPDNLKSGMENLSGQSLDHVKVHYNSPKPATVQAHAYVQGSDIHLASGQEKHLPHELGHVVQQAQGRVKPTTSVTGMQVNDNSALENEATSMGQKAMQRVAKSSDSLNLMGENTLQYKSAKENSNPSNFSQQSQQRAIDSSPRQVSQRKQYEGVSGHPLQRADYPDKPPPVPDGKRIAKEMSDTDPAADAFQPGGKITAAMLKTLLNEAAIAAFKTYRFQGTKSRVVPDILEKGLDPEFGGSGAAKGDKAFEEDSKNHIYYTPNFSTADSYRARGEGAEKAGFDPNPGRSEVLEIYLPEHLKKNEVRDGTEPGALMTTDSIPAEYIRSTEPHAVPSHPEGGAENPLSPGANDKAWMGLLRSGNIESGALFTNMTTKGQALINALVEGGLDRQALMASLKQGLRSLSVSDMMEVAKAYAVGMGPQVGGTSISAMGITISISAMGIPLKHTSEHLIEGESLMTLLERERALNPPGEKGKEEESYELAEVRSKIAHIKKPRK
jgi:hypothetical protein